MITFHIKEQRPPTYRNCVVLTASFMHGDADIYTSENMVASVDSQDELHVLKAIYDVYTKTKRRSYPDVFILNLEGADPVVVYNDYRYDDEYPEIPDMNVGSDLERMFPWDETQAEMGMYDNRACLENFSLAYYDDSGTAYDVTLEGI